MTNKGKKSDVSTDGALSLCFGAHTLSHGARDRVRAHLDKGTTRTHSIDTR